MPEFYNRTMEPAILPDPVGFGHVQSVLGLAEVDELIDHLPALEGMAGTRLLLTHEWCWNLALDPRLCCIARRSVGEAARPVRAILFDKSPDTNWLLGWHQDTNIAVTASHRAFEGFRAWSEKEGVPHVLPPREVLDATVALRVHLDDCGIDNGPLRAIPGSHLDGLRPRPTPEELATQQTLTARAGDVLWMRALVFHASAKALAPKHRRVIHIEYSSATLPAGMDWAWRNSA